MGRVKIGVRSAFSMIELLVVVGIIAILSVALITILNPAEAQRKARDSQRLRDVTTIHTILIQAVEKGIQFTACTPNNPCRSDSLDDDAIGQAACNDPVGGSAVNVQWLGGADVDLCQFARGIPTDPENGQLRRCTATDSHPNGDQCIMRYMVAFNPSDSRNFEIFSFMESMSNHDRVAGDGGSSERYYEFGSGGDVVSNEDSEVENDFIINNQLAGGS